VARVLVVTGGYRGDVLPFVPIARELARRAHEVRVLVPRDFHALLADEPFDVPVEEGHDFGPSFLEPYAPFMARWGTRLGGVRVPRLMLRLVTERLDEVIDAVDPHTEWADVVLAHPVAALSTTMPAERRGVPWISGDLFPMLLPSAAAPPMGAVNLGPRANRAAWQLARSSAFDAYSYANRFKAARRRLGLPVDGWNLVDARVSPHLNLGLASPHYVDHQPDWPTDYQLVGFTPWEGPDDFDLPDDVSAFLGDGPPPVAVTLGTSAASAHPALFTEIAEALDARGERGIFLTSTDANAARLRASGAASRHGIWPFVPLAPVLERCRAVVHSGAHGTNALALRAGLPSAIRPCLQDQVWHADRQEQLGTGVHIRRRRVRAAIARILDDGDLADRARILGEKISAEDGTSNACDAIDGFLRTGHA
jgi:rhamnosyltransferase subunit B